MNPFADVPLFDMLTGARAPFAGFGEPLAASEEPVRVLAAEIAAARRRVVEGFDCDLLDARESPGRLDGIIRGMWATGWSPETGNIRLFARDFGLVFFDAIRERCAGREVFRSATNLTHLSLWWPLFGLEAFPFHHVIKSLSEPDGASLAYFARSLAADLGRA